MTRSQTIQEYTRINRKYEVAFMPSVKAAIQSKVTATMNDLKTKGVNYAMNQLTQDTGNNRLAAVVKKLYTTVGLRFARMNETRLRKEPMQQKRLGFNQEWTNYILNYLSRFLISKITFEVNETTRNKLLAVLQNGMTEGLSIDEMVARLKDLPFTRMQAARIVRTEVNRAANVGTKAQAQTFEYELQKEWISIHDNRTRGNPMTGQDDHSNHWSLDKTVIDMNDDFVDPRNGDRLQQPGDPNASAASTINCRCQMGTIAKRDKEGNLIPKRSRVSVIYPGQIRRPQTITV